MKSRFLTASFALFLAAATARAAPGPVRLAVLEFEVAPDLKIDRTYFSDLARGAVHRGAPQIFVMTRESTEALLGANGKTMGDCIGECEVEVGRKLGADYIVSGRITQVGSRLSLTMRLFSTADGELVESAEARGRSADELLDHVDAAMESLVAPLGKSLLAARGTAPAKAVAPAPAVQTINTAPTAAAPTLASSPAAPAPAPPAAALPAPAAPTASLATAAPPEPRAPLYRAADANAVSSSSASGATSAPVPAPADAVQATATPSASNGHKWGWIAIGTGALIAGGSAAFDNLSSTSKDGKLTAVDFLPIAGYAVALALGGYGVYQVVKP